MRTFDCACGNKLYFENSACLKCGGELGYLPDRHMIARITPEAGDLAPVPPREEVTQLVGEVAAQGAADAAVPEHDGALVHAPEQVVVDRRLAR